LCIHEPVVRDARYSSFWHHNKTLAVLWITICQGNVPAIVHMSLAFYKGMSNYYSEHCAPCGTHSPGQSGIGLTFEYAIQSRNGQDGYFFMTSSQSNAVDGDEEFVSVLSNSSVLEISLFGSINIPVLSSECWIPRANLYELVSSLNNCRELTLSLIGRLDPLMRTQIYTSYHFPAAAIILG